MKRILCLIGSIVLLIVSYTPILQCQMNQLSGTDNEFRMGVHSGNLFRVSFYNDGTFGRVGQTSTQDVFIGEWPINSGHYYLVDGNIFVGAEVKDRNGNLIHIFSENKSAGIGGSRGDIGPNGWRTFLPLAGFANPTGSRIAMATGIADKSNSWPSFWPDIKDPENPYGLYNPDGWAGSWNGYFGRDVFNADEESYYVADDYNNDEFNFYPDSTNLKRRGLGMRIYVRGFQWSKASVADGIFCLYDIQNIGTHKFDKMVFGYKIGNNMGESSQGSDHADDCAAFNRDLNFSYMWDNDNRGAGGYTPVGYMGGAFLESPGNSYDGIDNDNDGNPNSPIYAMKNKTVGPVMLKTVNGEKLFYAGSGSIITNSMFSPKVLDLDDKIVLIDYKSKRYDRIVTTLRDTLTALLSRPATTSDTLTILFGDEIYKFWHGKTMTEIGDNLFDDNLNGIIDENRGVVNPVTGILTYLYLDHLCIDYFNNDSTTNGVLNPLLDEQRNDGVDNDGDWDPRSDDFGNDGLGPNDRKYPGPDLGEGDGLPTAGEPHFDKTDIDETDMLGLTSFILYEWNSTLGTQQSDDEWLWDNLRPGNFSNPLTNVNVELLYGSGYFPIWPSQVERISMAIICGTDYDDLIRNKGYFALAYNQNYNFSKAPYPPNVRAIAGNNSVKLFWDDIAESSVDPITGKDFEGYRIYRSTDPGWNDCKPITDAYGNVVFRMPIAQFDLVNGIRGLHPIATQGVHFYLGEDTGLRHYWEDTTAKNGFTYYYAVTSYDRGSDTLGIDPSECGKYVAISASGVIEKGPNIVVVRPEAPVAGYVPGGLKDARIQKEPGSTAEGTIDYEVIDPSALKNNNRYMITFKDTTDINGYYSTKSFTLIDLGTPEAPANDTILANSILLNKSDEQLDLVSKTGIKLGFLNNPAKLDINLQAENVGWSRRGIRAYQFAPFRSLFVNRQPTNLVPSGNYKVIFGEVGIDTSAPFYRWFTTERRLLTARPVNFTIINTMTGEKVKFGFYDWDSVGDRRGKFSYTTSPSFRTDEIIFLNPNNDTVPHWCIKYALTTPAGDTAIAQQGDELNLPLTHPFLSNDVFTFTTTTSKVDRELAKSQLDNIRVVPNPYIISNSWEPKNPYTTGRGPRELHFIHLPKNCTIQIFNIRGQLVRTLYHNSNAEDGTLIWDMLTKDNLDIAFGIYIYHVNAPGIGEKIGKFVVIK